MTSLFYQDEKVKLYQDDVLSWALDYKKKIDAGEALPFMAVLCDPPYGLSEPPPIDEVLRAWLAGDKYEYNKGGMMSLKWDSLPPGPQVWRALLDITHFGGYLFAFSGTRTADLLGIACRLGGWEPFDRVASFAWVQAQGFVKNTNISKMLDKEAGAEREVVGLRVDADGRCRARENYAIDGGKRHTNNSAWESSTLAKDNIVTAPATELAKQFHGYGNAIAPKHEPILLFRKPREGRTFAQCARTFGSGALNIDQCRVAGVKEGDPLRFTKSKRATDRSFGKGGDKGDGGMYDPGRTGVEIKQDGRWPPNTHFTHAPPTSTCPACNGSGCDECHGRGVVGGCRRVGSKRVKSPVKPHRRNVKTEANFYGGSLGKYPVKYNTKDYANPDGLETVDDFVCIDGCAIAKLDEMAGERKSGTRKARTNQPSDSVARGDFNEWESKHYQGDAGSASRFYPNHDWSYEIAERLASETPFKYVPKVSNSERSFGLAQHLPRTRNSRKRRHQDLDGSWLARAKCKHPTLKPLSLLVWLAKLCKPPDMFSPRICIPFAGAMSEAMAARLAGWQEIHAIELERVHCEWGVARWKAMGKWARLTGKSEPGEIIKLAEAAEAKTAPRGDERQTSLFGALGLE